MKTFLRIIFYLFILGGMGIFVVGMLMNLTKIGIQTKFYIFFNDNFWGWILMFGSIIVGIIGLKLVGNDDITYNESHSGSSYNYRSNNESKSYLESKTRNYEDYDNSDYDDSSDSSDDSISSVSSFVGSKTIYDNDGNSVGYKVGDRYYDNDGSSVGYDVGDNHYDSDGNSIGYRVGDDEYDSDGNSVGYWIGDTYYDNE